MICLRLMSLVIGFHGEPVLATTVSPELKTCPVCQRAFVATSITSWHQFGEPRRDLTGSYLAAASRLLSCPRCLYSALPSDLGSLDEETRRRIQTVLASLPQGVRPLPPSIRRAALHGGRWRTLASESLLHRVAEQCEAARAPDPDRAAGLAYSAYVIAKAAGDEQVLREERWQAIRAFERAASEPVRRRSERHVLWLYLAGELRRSAGDTNGAVTRLEEAARLAEPTGGGGADEADWLRNWSREQAGRARSGDTNSAPGTRLYSAETEAFRLELERKLPAMETALKAGRPSGEWLLSGTGRRQTISLVLDLAREGNSTAIVFLYRWLGRLETSELPARDYRVVEAVRLLGQRGEVVEDDAVASVRFRCPALGEMARYAVRGGVLPVELRRALAGTQPLEVIGFAGIAAATGRSDPGLKTALGARMRRLKGEMSLVEWIRDYFGAVGSVSDIPALETYANEFGPTKAGALNQDWPVFWRQDVEDAIRLINLRAVFER